MRESRDSLSKSSLDKNGKIPEALIDSSNFTCNEKTKENVRWGDETTTVSCTATISRGEHSQKRSSFHTTREKCRKNEHCPNEEATW